jgi:hypothetical protein
VKMAQKLWQLRKECAPIFVATRFFLGGLALRVLELAWVLVVVVSCLLSQLVRVDQPTSIVIALPF